MLAIVAIFSVFVLALIIVVLGLSFFNGLPGDPGLTYGLGNYREIFGNAEILTVLGNTIEFCLLSLLVALAVGVPAAWLVERTDLPGKKLLLTFMTLGLLIPGFASAMGWLFVLHPRIGLANLWLKQALGVSGPVFDILNVPGMAWVQGLSLAPLAFIMIAGVFRANDPSLEEAAQMTGARWHQVLRRVTLRLAWPGIMAASIYIFTIGFAAFDVPAIIGWGGQIFTFSTYLYQQINGVTQLPRYGLGAALSTLVMVMAAALSLWYAAMQRQAHRYAVIKGKAYRPSLIRLGGWKFAAWAFLATYLVLSELVPTALLVWSSLLPFFQVPSARALSLLSLKNYTALPWDLAIDAMRNTAILMVLTATVTMIVSVAFSWVVLRSRLPGRRYVDVIAFLPHAIPNIIFGVGALLLALYVLQAVVPLYGTLWILLLVFVVARVSYGTRMTNAALIQIHTELEESAEVSGAGTFGTLRAITLPLLAPTLLYAWIWIALLTFRELTLAVILTTTDNITMPVVVWSLWGGGGLGKASALTVILMILIVPLLGLYWLIGKGRGANPMASN
jgi:iron(III) transport system permease protein